MDKKQSGYEGRIKEISRLREEDCLPEIERRRLDERVVERMFEIWENEAWHNDYDQEIRELSAIAQGDVRALEESIQEDYPGSLGVLNEEDVLRNAKNICIVVITLASRAAIQGGLFSELAFAISDIYINEVERSTDIATASMICRGAEYRYARLVRDASLRMEEARGEGESKENRENKAKWRTKEDEALSGLSQVLDWERERKAKEKPVNDYVSRAKDVIFRHLHDRISTKEIAQELGLNDKYLSTLFHQETGVTISQYIRKEKINLVKNMLKYSDYSFLEIANYLSFSSQSHLGEQFRRETGMTLGEYRKTFKRRESPGGEGSP